ncbi:MAG: response regulator transcription factor [Opitutae bacterium]|nr:response regulator transcription factor [Opitutae bacterium]
MNPPLPPIRTLIVDDEPTARRGVRLLLAADPEIEIIGEAGTGAEAVECIRRDQPALIFLDVQMPQGDGFKVLESFAPAQRPAVVFVTAYDEYALKAFDVHAVDYLLKPYDDARFRAALDRAKHFTRHRQTSAIDDRLQQLLAYLKQTPPADERETEAARPDRILIKSAGEIIFLKAEEIDWIEAEGDYMKFHVDGRAHLQRETMARLEARLDPKRFVRIHRSTIVNIDRVRKLSPSFLGEYAVVLQDGTKLKLSRGYHDRLTTLLQQGL